MVKTITHKLNAGEMLYELWLNGITDNDVITDTVCGLVEDGYPAGEILEVDLVVQGPDAVVTFTVEDDDDA